jgi:hypothetical protein
MLLMGMGDAPPAPGRNAAEDEARRKAGLVGPPRTRRPRPSTMRLVDLGAQLLAGGVAAVVLVGGFLFWRSRR